MGWTISKLTEISLVQTGKWDANHATESGNYKFFTCAYDSFLCDTKRFHGDCLILPGNGINVGEVFYYSGEFDAYQRTYVASDIQIDPKFLFYHMKCFWRERNLNKQFGAATNYLKIGNFKDYEVAYPPLPEQQRIVTILDQAFADIEKTRANAEQNLKNTREVFDSYLQQVFSQRGEGWVEETLSNICDVRDGTHDSPKYLEEGVPFITQKNIREDGLSFKNTKFISESDHNHFYKRSNVSLGDILISMIGVNRGMACVVDEHRIFSIKNVGLIKKSPELNMLFLLYYLQSSFAKNYIESESRGGAQPFIGLTKLRAFPILQARPKDQEIVVSQLGVIESRSRRLISLYDKKIQSLDELKKSLLKKAFSGELTTETDTPVNEAIA